LGFILSIVLRLGIGPASCAGKRKFKKSSMNVSQFSIWRYSKLSCRTASAVSPRCGAYFNLVDVTVIIRRTESPYLSKYRPLGQAWYSLTVVNGSALQGSLPCQHYPRHQ
jgi:hypothetical protein